MDIKLSRLLLQCAVAVCGCVPVIAGLLGALNGGMLFNDIPVAPALDSHMRYLSGLLMAIGIGFWNTIPKIETHSQIIKWMTCIVFIGGLSRLAGAAASGVFSNGILFALTMELIITPVLCLWQRHIAARTKN